MMALSEPSIMNQQAEEVHISEAVWRYATNLNAEAMALITAVTEILTNLDKIYKKAVGYISLMPCQCLMLYGPPPPLKK